MKRIAYLDGWRGLAICSLLVGHFLSLRGLSFGRFGVELFFVLSGRLMAEILFVERLSLKDFFQRRISRVWPATLGFVVAMFAVFGSGLFETPISVNIVDTLLAATFTLNYAIVDGYKVSMIDHIWSLCIEEHTYVLLAIIAFISRRTRLNPAIACGALAGLCILNGFCQTVIFELSYKQVYWRTDVRAASILLPVALWLVYRHKEWPTFAPIAFAIGAVALNVSPVPDYLKYSAGTACLALTLISLPSGPVFLSRILEHPVSLRMGVWSFSIYLWQQPFSKASQNQSALTVVLLLLGAFACALVSFYFIEKPARRFLNARWTRKTSKSPQTSMIPPIVGEKLSG